MITKIFADGQVWSYWGMDFADINHLFVSSDNTTVTSYTDLECYLDFKVLVDEKPPETNNTPVTEENSIVEQVHSLCTELHLTYSYHPAEGMFLVDHNDTTFKLKTSDDVGKLRHMVSLFEELCYE